MASGESVSHAPVQPPETALEAGGGAAGSDSWRSLACGGIIQSTVEMDNGRDTEKRD